VIAVPVLVRTVRTDPRPAFGFLITVVTATLGLSVVLGGTLAFASSTSYTAEALEVLVQLTALSAVVASFLAARGLAISLLPETRILRAIGTAEVSLGVVGALAVSATTLVVALAGTLSGESLTTSWLAGLAHVLDAAPPLPGHIPSAEVSGMLALVCMAGWWSGLRAGGARDARSGPLWRAAGAITMVVMILAPSLLAVTLAPQLVGLARGAGEDVAADRFAMLDSTDGTLVILYAAAFALVGAASILAADAARGLVGIIAHLVRSGPTGPFIGLRLARARIGSFGALTTLVAAGVGLAVTRAMTASVAASMSSDKAGAGMLELSVTLGPALVIATAAAVGAVLAQSRGTGADIARLRRIGCSGAGTGTALLVAAIAVGASGALIGFSAALGVALVGMASGVEATAFLAMSPTVPIVAALTAMIVSATVFVCSELVGVLLDGRRPRSMPLSIAPQGLAGPTTVSTRDSQV
jgi:hypothetical protein